MDLRQKIFAPPELTDIKKERLLSLLALLMEGSRSAWDIMVYDPGFRCRLQGITHYQENRCLFYARMGSPSCNICHNRPKLRNINEIITKEEIMSKRGICANNCTTEERALVAKGLCWKCYSTEPSRVARGGKRVPVSGVEGYQQPKTPVAASSDEIVMRIKVTEDDDLWLRIKELADREDRTAGQQIFNLLKKSMGIDPLIKIWSSC